MDASQLNRLRERLADRGGAKDIKFEKVSKQSWPSGCKGCVNIDFTLSGGCYGYVDPHKAWGSGDCLGRRMTERYKGLAEDEYALLVESVREKKP